MIRLVTVLLLALGLALSARPAPAQAADCQFVLGFQALRSLIPDIVGNCLENEHHNPANGDGLQQTSGGLLVWRKADNWTAFTDGSRTWINGPYGLQERLNTQRFPWEHDLAAFPMGIRIDSPEVLAFWNQHARPNDVAWAGLVNLDLLTQVRVGSRALTFGHLENAPKVIDAAKSNGIGMVLFDREQTEDCNLLASEEATAYNLAKSRGLTFIFAPTGVALRKCYQAQPSLIQDTDVVIYQTEAIQEKDPNYVDDVRDVIRNIKAIRPGTPVWVQVSVNPPADRAITPDEVVQTINALEDGPADRPDEVHVFYYSTERMADRVPAMEQVIQTFRPTRTS